MVVIEELHGNKKSILGRQILKRKESKHSTSKRNQIERVEGKKKKERTKNDKNYQKSSGKMVINTYLSIIKCNGLNAPVEGHRYADWLIKQDPSICCLQEIHIRAKGTHTH